jgi:hypothetical protein
MVIEVMLHITYFVHILLFDVGIFQNLLDRFHGLPEQVHVQLLKLGTRQSLGEVIAIFEAFDLDSGTLLAGQGPLSLFDFTLKFSESPQVLGDIGTSLLLVGFDQVVDDTVVEIFTTKVSITSSSQDFEDTVVDGKKGNIEGSSTKIVDNDLGFTRLLVKTIGDGSSGRLINDTKDLETSDSSGIFGSLTLSVVEVYVYRSISQRKKDNQVNVQAGTVTTA